MTLSDTVSVFGEDVQVNTLRCLRFQWSERVSREAAEGLVHYLGRRIRFASFWKVASPEWCGNRSGRNEFLIWAAASDVARTARSSSYRLAGPSSGGHEIAGRRISNIFDGVIATRSVPGNPVKGPYGRRAQEILSWACAEDPRFALLETVFVAVVLTQHCEAIQRASRREARSASS